MVASSLRGRCSRGAGSVLILTFLALGAADASAQVVQPSAASLAELDRRVQAHLDDNNIPGGGVEGADDPSQDVRDGQCGAVGARHR